VLFACPIIDSYTSSNISASETIEKENVSGNPFCFVGLKDQKRLHSILTKSCSNIY